MTASVASRIDRDPLNTHVAGVLEETARLLEEQHEAAGTLMRRRGSSVSERSSRRPVVGSPVVASYVVGS